MLDINDNSDELVIREVNEFRWLVFAVLLISSFVAGYNLFLLHEKNAILLTVISGIISLFTAFYLIINPATTIKLNKKSKLLVIEKKGLFKNSLKFYPFRDIADPIYAEEIKTSGEKDVSYQFIMRLRSGNEIRILANSKASESFNAANFMNDVIFDSPDKVQFKSSAFNEISF